MGVFGYPGYDGEVIFALSYIEIAYWALRTNFGHFQGYQVAYWPISCQEWGIGRWIWRLYGGFRVPWLRW